jgi:hypothetical protein
MTTPTRSTRFVALSIAAALLTACGGSGGSSSVSPNTNRQPGDLQATLGKPFTLKVGEHASVDGVSIRVGFDSVTADSRCPMGAMCIRAGEAVVKLDVESNGRTVVLSLQTPPGLTPTTDKPAEAPVDGYIVAFSSLTPKFAVGNVMKQSDYSAEFVVRAK